MPASFTLDKVPSDIKLTDAQKMQVRVYRSGETVLDKESDRQRARRTEFSAPFHRLRDVRVRPCRSSIGFLPMTTSLCNTPCTLWDRQARNRSIAIFSTPGRDDPTASFLDSLKQHVGSFGAIIVWNKSFESQVNDRIAHRVPEAEAISRK